MNELVIYMAGAILLLTAVLAAHIVWTRYEIERFRKHEKKIQRLAKAANAWLYAHLYAKNDVPRQKAQARLFDCLSGLMEEE